MVIHPVFYWIEGFFLLGVVGTILANIKAEYETQKSRWLKLAVHFFIVHALLFLILFFSGYFYLVIAGIMLIGAFEIIKNMRFITKNIFRNVVIILFYILIALGFILFTKIASVQLALYVFLLVFVFDGFAQISGQLFGQHQLFPIVSPGKSVEGLFGGTLIAMVTSCFINSWIHISLINSLVLAFLIIISALAGDWLASAFKRKQKIKDFSKIIPGHGGVLDRFDSWIFTGAILYLLILIELI